MVPNLDHLKKGGRITPAVAALAGLLKIVPIMKLNYSLGGKIDSFGKVRTAKKANLKLLITWSMNVRLTIRIMFLQSNMF